MKHNAILLIVLTAVIFSTSCQKNAPKEISRKTVDAKSLAYFEGEDEFDRSCEILKGDHPDDMSKWKYDCSNPGDECSVVAGRVLTTTEVTELATLDDLVGLNLANDYFSTPNWNVLFPQVVNEPLLLDELINGTVLLYQLPNGSGSTYQVTYVLTREINQANIDNSNIIAAWMF